MALSVAFYKSTPSTGAPQSLGGALTTAITSGATSIFTTPPSLNIGLTGLSNYNKSYIYRCIYIRNNHATTTYQFVNITLNPGDETYFTLEMALSSAGLNADAAAIGTELTAPAVTGSWGKTLSIPTLGVGQRYAIWLRQRGKDVGSGSNGTWNLQVDAKY
jgi:hypothetical protein